MAARIPIYSQQVGTPRNLGPGPTGNLPNVLGTGTGIAQAGDALQRAGFGLHELEKRKQEEDGAAWSAEQLSKARLDWTQQQIDREQNAPAGAANYTGTLSKDFDTYTEDLLQQAPTENARNYLRNQLTGLKTGLIGRGMEFEARSRLNDRLDKINTAVDNARIAVDLDPSQYQVALAENLSTLNALDIPEEKKRELAQNAQQALSFASVSSRMRSNPGAVLQQLGDQQGGGALDVRSLNADNRLRLRNQAEAELKRREAEAKQAAAISRAELAYRSQDALAGYMQGLEVENAPTAQEYIAAYGAERGQQMYTALTRAQAFGTDMQTFATLPINERAKFVQDRMPGAEGVVAGTGFAEQQQLFGQLVKQTQSMNKQLIEDGSGYAIKYAPQVEAAWQGVQSVDDPEAAPGAYQAFAEATTGEQTRLGIPAAKQTILPANYVNQMAAAFKDPANAGPRQLQMIDEMKRNWGQFFPQVFRQVSGAVPDSVKVIGSGVDKDTATLLANIANVETKDLKAAIPSSEVTALKTALLPALGQFSRTFTAQGRGGIPTMTTIQNEAERGALFLMASGKSAEDAAEEMATRLSANYAVDGTLRVPIQYDIDTVQQGINVAVSNLTAADVHLQEIQGIGGEFDAARTQVLLKSAQAVISPDEEGVRLMINGATVLAKDGSPLEFSFDDLLGLSAQEPKKTLPEQLPSRLR